MPHPVAIKIATASVPCRSWRLGGASGLPHDVCWPKSNLTWQPVFSSCHLVAVGQVGGQSGRITLSKANYLCSSSHKSYPHPQQSGEVPHSSGWCPSTLASCSLPVCSTSCLPAQALASLTSAAHSLPDYSGCCTPLCQLQHACVPGHTPASQAHAPPAWQMQARFT